MKTIATNSILTYKPYSYDESAYNIIIKSYFIRFYRRSNEYLSKIQNTHYIINI